MSNLVAFSYRLLLIHDYDIPSCSSLIVTALFTLTKVGRRLQRLYKLWATRDLVGVHLAPLRIFKPGTMIPPH